MRTLDALGIKGRDDILEERSSGALSSILAFKFVRIEKRINNTKNAVGLAISNEISSPFGKANGKRSVPQCSPLNLKLFFDYLAHVLRSKTVVKLF